jgi:hypothetical protein
MLLAVVQKVQPQPPMVVRTQAQAEVANQAMVVVALLFCVTLTHAQLQLAQV